MWKKAGALSCEVTIMPRNLFPGGNHWRRQSSPWGQTVQSSQEQHIRLETQEEKDYIIIAFFFYCCQVFSLRGNWQLEFWIYALCTSEINERKCLGIMHSNTFDKNQTQNISTHNEYHLWKRVWWFWLVLQLLVYPPVFQSNLEACRWSSDSQLKLKLGYTGENKSNLLKK